MIVIDLFEVPAGADDQFVETWEGAHDRTARVLYRALREDADFRFVEVASVEASEAGAYEVVHEDGVPDGSDGVALIDPFEVPETADESFLATWEAARAILASQPGYLGTRLHGSVGPSDFRFVNLARWSSPLALARATQRPEFQQTATAIPFDSHPALYTVIR